jgi:CRP/FNR family transcriptional regulator, cyclic AMP receptor protein
VDFDGELEGESKRFLTSSPSVWALCSRFSSEQLKQARRNGTGQRVHFLVEHTEQLKQKADGSKGRPPACNSGVARQVVKFKNGQVLFSQDDPCNDVLYIQSGNAKLTIVNPQGKEAVLALLGPGEFLGEGCIIGNPVRMATATAIAPLTAMSIGKKEMIRVLHDEPEFAGKFIRYMLERNLKTESDLVDQLFNSSEKRLARALLMLARYGKEGKPETMVAKISQETLAELVGTTRSRVSFFMNKFRKLGFIHYNGGLQVHSSLLNVVLHD